MLRISGSAVRMSQSFSCVEPVLTPPCMFSPFCSRALTVKSTPCHTSRLIADLGGQRVVVVHLAELGRHHVHEASHRGPAVVPQPRIDGIDDVELREVGGGERQVVGHAEVRPRAAEVADVDADARHQLVHDADRRFPVGLAVVEAGDEIRVELLRRYRRAERQVAGLRALAVGLEVGEVAVRDEVAVGVVPRAGRRDRAGDDRRVGLAAQAVERLAQQVLVEAELHRRLAGAEEVVGEAAPVGQVLPVDVVRGRERDVPVRRQRHRAERLSGKLVWNQSKRIAPATVSRSIVHRSCA